jgi:hypothetical protein
VVPTALSKPNAGAIFKICIFIEPSPSKLVNYTLKDVSWDLARKNNANCAEVLSFNRTEVGNVDKKISKQKKSSMPESRAGPEC